MQRFGKMLRAVIHPCRCVLAKSIAFLVVGEDGGTGARRSKGGAALTKDEYALTWWESLLVVTKWQWLIVSRDPALIYGRMIQVTPA